MTTTELTPVAVTGLSLVPMMKLKSYVSRLQAGVPRDSQDHPLKLVIPTLVQATNFIQSPETLLDELSNYAVDIDYDNGYPCIEGLPVWEKQEFETDPEFELFTKYKKMGEVSLQRSTYKLSLDTGIDVKKLEALKVINHWRLRAEAEDFTKEITQQQVTLKNRKELSQKHLDIGNHLVDMCMETFEKYREMISPKLALDILKEATKMQKEAVGLPTSTKGFATLGDVAPVSVSINNVSASGHSTTSVNVGGPTGDKQADGQRLAELLNVMESTGILQTPIDVEGKEVEDDEQQD